MKKKIILTILLVVAVATGGGLFGAWIVSQRTGSDSPVVVRRSENDGNSVQLESEANIAKVAQEVSPSVVSIVTQKVGSGVRGQQGAGTGIIISGDGYVVTNKHVVSGSREVAITLADGTIHDDVSIIGVDPLNDVAFLKIRNGKDLPAAKLGESSTLRIGQNVVAIGNTLGEYQNTVTSGIVSGLGRPITAQADESGQAELLTDLVQTDAAINPGNSGGPLVNLAGQVVGINTAIVSNAQGIGFAIPINAIKGLLEGVLKHGKIERAYLGVRYADITPTIAKQRNLPVKKGAIVLGNAGSGGIDPGGPADKAGIKEGDVITKIGELEVGVHGGVSSLVAEYKPGDTIQVTILRDGKEQQLHVTLATYKEPPVAPEELEERQSQRDLRRQYDWFDF